MKKFLIVLFSLAVVHAQAQTADDVIQKYATAMGGLDAFNKTTTVKMTGTLTAQANELPFTMVIINNKAMRSDAEFMGQSVTSVYNNGTGWKINPFTGISSAADVTGTELIDYNYQAGLANNLMDYKSRGHKVELLGQEEVEGVKANKLKLTAKEDGRVTTYYISTTDNLLLKSTSEREIQGQAVIVETYYSDMKKFGGLVFAVTRTQKIDGEVFQSFTLTNVELNVKVDEKIFNK